MFVDGDIYGWYEKCLQCGYCCELKGLGELGQSPALKDERLIRAPCHKTGGK